MIEKLRWYFENNFKPPRDFWLSDHIPSSSSNVSTSNNATRTSADKAKSTKESDETSSELQFNTEPGTMLMYDANDWWFEGEHETKHGDWWVISWDSQQIEPQEREIYSRMRFARSAKQRALSTCILIVTKLLGPRSASGGGGWGLDEQTCKLIAEYCLHSRPAKKYVYK
jgi:hypothetical protein